MKYVKNIDMNKISITTPISAICLPLKTKSAMGFAYFYFFSSCSYRLYSIIKPSELFLMAFLGIIGVHIGHKYPHCYVTRRQSYTYFRYIFQPSIHSPQLLIRNEKSLLFACHISCCTRLILLSMFFIILSRHII